MTSLLGKLKFTELVQPKGNSLLLQRSKPHGKNGLIHSFILVRPSGNDSGNGDSISNGYGIFTSICLSFLHHSELRNSYNLTDFS